MKNRALQNYFRAGNWILRRGGPDLFESVACDPGFARSEARAEYNSIQTRMPEEKARLNLVDRFRQLKICVCVVYAYAGGLIFTIIVGSPIAAKNKANLSGCTRKLPYRSRA